MLVVKLPKPYGHLILYQRESHFLDHKPAIDLVFWPQIQWSLGFWTHLWTAGTENNHFCKRKLICRAFVFFWPPYVKSTKGVHVRKLIFDYTTQNLPKTACPNPWSTPCFFQLRVNTQQAAFVWNWKKAILYPLFPTGSGHFEMIQFPTWTKSEVWKEATTFQS